LYRRPGQVGYRVEVSLKKGTAPGPLRENILIKTNDPELASFSLPVRAAFESSPPADSPGVRVTELPGEAKRP
jgi:hypothetical protein